MNKTMDNADVRAALEFLDNNGQNFEREEWGAIQTIRELLNAQLEAAEPVGNKALDALDVLCRKVDGYKNAKDILRQTLSTQSVDVDLLVIEAVIDRAIKTNEASYPDGTTNAIAIAKTLAVQGYLQPDVRVHDIAVLREALERLRKPTTLSQIGKLPDYAGQLENLSYNKAIDDAIKAIMNTEGEK